jgi:hypothetical protein
MGGKVVEYRIRHIGEKKKGRKDSHVQTWWTRRMKGKFTFIASNNLQPVSLPVGLEATMVTIFRSLSKRKDS